MKIKTWTVGFAVLALVAAPAFAETGTGQRTYDQMVVPVGCEAAACDDSCCDDGCDCGDPCCGDEVESVGLLSGMGPGIVEGFTLANMLGIEAWDIGGWSEFGWTDDAIPLSPQGSNGSGLSFRDTPDDLDLNQQWFYIGKTADGSDGIGFGFRFDAVYGTDAQKTQSFGNPPGVVTGGPGDGTFDNNTEWDHGVYGWAIPQLYGEVAIGDLAIKGGHFYTPMGYEVVPATGNFFYSHSLSMFNSEPFTHTGVLTTFTGFETLTLYNGWMLGWDTGFDQLNSGNVYLGGIGATLLDSVSFTYLTCYGNFGDRDLGGSDSYSHSVVFNVTVTDALNYIAQSDYLRTDNTDEDDFSIIQYLIFGANDWLSAGGRMEWWKDEGVSHYECTGGFNVKLLGNCVLRPEMRQDWVPATDESFENMACDMILTY